MIILLHNHPRKTYELLLFVFAKTIKMGKELLIIQAILSQKFAQRKGVANICFLQSKAVANMVTATFATIFARHCKYGSKCGFYHVCYRFVLEQTYVCHTFALCKFNVNPFFRPVIAVIAVAPTGKASFVYSFVQTRLITIKPLITAIKAIPTIAKRQLVKMKTGKLPLLIFVFFLVSLLNQADCFYPQGVRHYICVSVINL